MNKKQALKLLQGIIFSIGSFCFMYLISYALLSEITINQNIETYKAIKGISLISAVSFMLLMTFMFWHIEWQKKKLLKENKNGKT